MFYLLKFTKRPIVASVQGAFETYMAADEEGAKTCNGNYLIINKREDLLQFKGEYLTALKTCLLDKGAKVNKTNLISKLWAALTVQQLFKKLYGHFRKNQ